MQKDKDNRRTPTAPAALDDNYVRELEAYIAESPYLGIEKFENFAKYTPRWSIMRFLTKYEMFKRIMDVEGIIIEAGVFRGGGLMSWAHLSTILEPYNHQRHVVGFDTFKGFPPVTGQDGATHPRFNTEGAWSSDSHDDILRSASIHDHNRPMAHIPKVELVKGDVVETAPQFLAENPQTLISLLYLDVDLYEPTKKLLEVFGPRVPKGGIIAFDEINTKFHPGETLAVDEVFGIRNLEIKRFSFGTSITYAVVQ